MRLAQLSCFIIVLTALCGRSVAQSQQAGLLPAELLNAYGEYDNANTDDRNYRIASDDNGNQLGIWIQANGQPPYQPTGGLLCASHSATDTSWIQGAMLVSGGVDYADVCYGGSGKWVAVWYQGGLSAAVSSDMGQTWSAPVELVPAGYYASKFSSEIQLASDSNGNILAMSTLDDITPGGAERSYVVRSTDYGASWSAPSEITPIHHGREAQIAYGGNGSWLVVYPTLGQTIQIGEYSISVSTYNLARSADLGMTWQNVGPIFNSIEKRQLSNFALAGNGNSTKLAAININTSSSLSEPIKSGGIAVFNIIDNGTTVSEPQWIRSYADAAETHDLVYIQPKIASDESDNWLFSIREGSTTDTLNVIKTWRTADSGSTWTMNTTAIPGEKILDYELAGVSDNEFTIFAGYRENPLVFGNSDIDIATLQTSSSGQLWTDFAYVNDYALSDFGLYIDADPDLASGGGTVLACWETVSAFHQDAIVISRSIDDGSSWGFPKVISSAYGFRSQMEYEGNNTWRCYWETKEHTFYFSESVDDGITWGAPQVTANIPERDLTTAQGNTVTLRTTTTVELDPISGNYRLDTFVQQSTDNGSTWGAQILAHTEMRAPAAFSSDYYGMPIIVSIEGDRFGILIQNMFVGKNYAFGYPTILGRSFNYVESSDGGNTWTEPQQVIPGEGIPGSGKRSLIASRGGVVIAFAYRLWPSHPAWGLDADIMVMRKPGNGPAAAVDWALFK